MTQQQVPPIDPRLVDRAQEQLASRRARILRIAIAEHSAWAQEQLPRPRRHDVALRRRARRIGEGIDLGGA
jgi:hypothetical protein